MPSASSAAHQPHRFPAPHPASASLQPRINALEAQVVELARQSGWITTDLIYQKVLGHSAGQPIPATARAAVSRGIRRLIKLELLKRTDSGIIRWSDPAAILAP